MRAARLVMEAIARGGPGRDAAAETHSDGRRTGRRIVGCGGGAAGAAGAGRPPAAARQAERTGRSNSAATCRSSCWAAGRSGSAAAPSSFPCPTLPPARGLLLAPEVHVSTPEAYRALSPRLTTESLQNKIVSFQSHTWELSGWAPAENDFEAVVFEQHRRLAALKRRLIQAGASPAMMTGSGSALFGLFRNRAEVSRAIQLMKHSEPMCSPFPSRWSAGHATAPCGGGPWTNI